MSVTFRICEGTNKNGGRDIELSFDEMHGDELHVFTHGTCLMSADYDVEKKSRKGDDYTGSEHLDERDYRSVSMRDFHSLHIVMSERTLKMMLGLVEVLQVGRE